MTSALADALLALHYDHGQKQYELQRSIPSGGQMWVNLAGLIRERTPDRNGNALPIETKAVTFDLKDLSAATSGVPSLTLSSLAVNTTAGYSTTAPDCPVCCYAQDDFFSPDPVDIVVNGLEQISVNGTNSCTGFEEDVTASAFNWGSKNVNIAQVTKAQAKGIAVGQVFGFVEIMEGCGCGERPVEFQLPLNVHPTVSFSGSVPAAVAAVKSGAPGAHEVFIDAVCNPQGQVNPQFNWSISQSGQYASLDPDDSGGPTMGIIGASPSPKNNVVVSLTCTDLNSKETSSPISTALTVQQPSGLTIVAPDSTTLNKTCSSGQCGSVRTFTYQVTDQNGDSMTEGGIDFWDYITTGSTNSCNLQSYKVTCNLSGVPSGTQTGSCGKVTSNLGQFPETLSICAPICGSASNGKCTGSCSTTSAQTWVLNGFDIAKSLTYQCNSVAVQ